MDFKSIFKKNNHRWAITNRMFFSLFLTGSVIEFSQVGSGFIDGLVISRFLGSEAMAAEGIVHPIYSIMGVISGLLAVGMQVRCTQLIGRGQQKELSRFFSATVYVGTVVSLLLTALALIFAKPFAALLGASGNGAELLIPASRYLIGIGVGIPPLIMTAILAPAFQLDSGRKTIQTGAIIEAAADIVLDIIAVKLGFGIIGVGLATAAASYLNLMYQCTHFLKKDRMLHFVRPDMPVREFMQMLSYGGERALKRVFNTLRPIILNTIIIAYGGALAMSALSVRNSLSNFVEIFGAGIASAVALLTGLYYGEVNDEAIEAVSVCRRKTITVCCGAVCVALFLLAPFAARLYVSGDGELCDMVTFAIRMLALQNPLQALVTNRIKYLQAIQRRRNMNLLIFAAQFGFVLLSAFALGRLFGVYGILACFTVSDALSLLAVRVFYAIKCRRLIPSRRDILALPDEFQLSPAEVISLDIRNMDDVSLASEQIMLFCKGHKIEHRTAYYAALCFEELAANTVMYGFAGNRSAHPIIDLRVVITENRFVIRMRDDCRQYDVTKQIAAANADTADPTRNIGIRIVSAIASDINYMHAFETNSLIISFDL
ncbi:MAG: MATE family efflux transporter [Eubacteriales bacterium]|nr:MATE family efflux transporter [Eubacteriales bacterium]